MMKDYKVKLRDLHDSYTLSGYVRVWTPKDRDEINRPEVYECDGWVSDLEDIGAPSIFRTIRSFVALVRMLSILDLMRENKQAQAESTDGRATLYAKDQTHMFERKVVIKNNGGLLNIKKQNHLFFLFLPKAVFEHVYISTWSVRRTPHDGSLVGQIDWSVVYCCLLWINKVRAKDKTYIWRHFQDGCNTPFIMKE